MSIIHPINPPAKWTRGEVMRAYRDGDDECLRDIVADLLFKGAHIVDWTDDRWPCEMCGNVGCNCDEVLARAAVRKAYPGRTL
jgi:hypothetical protein